MKYSCLSPILLGIAWILGSLPVSAQYAEDTVLVINEVMYNPTGTDESGEWIELHNQMGVDVDISNWRLAGAVSFSFPTDTVVPGGAYLVIAKDPGSITGAMGPFVGNLDNNGETIRLLNNSNRVMSRLSYNDAGEWPVGPDGSGATLAKIDPDSATPNPANWRSSAATGGTPGDENFPQGIPASTLWFNETNKPGNDFALEIVNSSDTGIDLSEWHVISSALTEPTALTGNIDPGAFRNFSASALGIDGSVEDDTRFFLIRTADDHMADAVRVGSSARARFPDGTGPWYRIQDTTPNTANSVELEDSIVINEIMYHHRPFYGVNSSDATPPLVSLDAAWRYETGGYEEGWAASAHDGWTTGEGVFANENTNSGWAADVQTVINGGAGIYRFELDFEFDGDPADTELFLSHIVDDGAVFYLNGTEILRHNMPDGPLSNNTRAVMMVETPDQSVAVPIPIDALINGINRLSAQVHQTGIFDSDVVFAAELKAVDALAEPPVYRENPEEWIELHNKSDTAVSLMNWTLSGGIGFDFEPDTEIAPGGYLVIARDANALRHKHPDLDNIVGNYSGRLDNTMDRVVLENAMGNPVDKVTYYDGGRWPSLADGEGSSMELIDPDADNSLGGSWAASDESAKSEWREYRYRGPATTGPGTNFPTQWDEFVMGLLDKGTFLLDDVSVVEDPDGAATELLRNRGFEPSLFGADGSQNWRLLGTHGAHGETVIMDDPDDEGNHVLHVKSTGRTEHMHNHLETTLRSGESVRRDEIYEISFRAKWLSGSPQLHTRLYFNYLAHVTILDQPLRHGTPGAPNSRVIDNAGPGFYSVRHSPAVPEANEAVTVSALLTDVDGVTGTTVFYRTSAAAAFDSVAATDDGNGKWSAVIPGMAAGSAIQFYMEAEDDDGAASWFPKAGPGSRAIVPVSDGEAVAGPGHNLRIAMLPEDTDWLHTVTNVMGNNRMGCTLIYKEREIFYDAGVRLKGSQRGRARDVRVGFNIGLPSDQRFRGIHQTITVDRSGAGDQYSQKEMMVKHAINRLGDIPGMYDDLINIIAPVERHNGAAMLVMARYDNEFLDAQFENGRDGEMYEYELIYFPTTTDGGDEGLKRPNPDQVRGVPLRSLGSNKEDYRWHYLKKNNVAKDDFSPMMNLLSVMEMSAGNDHQTAAAQTMDVDQWLRSFAVQVLFGIGDNYTSGAQHNAIFYFRPEDGRALFFPWDMDFTFSSSASGSMTPNGDLSKLLSYPLYKRQYYAHLLEMIETVYNRDYMETWAEHYSSFLPRENLGTHLSYINTRETTARSAINRAIDEVNFAITNNNGDDFTVDTPVVTLTGDGWLDVATVRREETGEELKPIWTDETKWELAFPLNPGANTITLQGLDFNGTTGSIFNPVGDDSIVVTYSGDEELASSENTIISEFMYHPADASPAEMAAGFNDQDDFEFIELLNIGENTVNLRDVEFTNGVRFSFESADTTTLAPGARLLLVRDLAGFAQRYGQRLAVAGEYSGSLSNGGERVTVMGAGGRVIADFKYDDGNGWPVEADGTGKSLVASSEAALDFADPDSWVPGEQTGGSPGEGETPVMAASLAEWLTAKGEVDPLADPNGDGIPLLLDYYLGESDMQLPDLTPSEDGSMLELRYSRRKSVAGVTVNLESSTDLQQWMAAGNSWTEKSRQSINDDYEEVVLQRARGQDTNYWRISLIVD